jgi:autotransporter family porin
MLRSYLLTNSIILFLMSLTSAHAATSYQETVKNTTINAKDIIKNENNITANKSPYLLINSGSIAMAGANAVGLKADDQITNLNITNIENNIQSNNIMAVKSTQKITNYLIYDIDIKMSSESIKGISREVANDPLSIEAAGKIKLENTSHGESHNYGILLENRSTNSGTINYDDELGMISLSSNGPGSNSGIMGTTSNGGDLVINVKNINNITIDGDHAVAINARASGSKTSNIYINLDKGLINSSNSSDGIRSINSSGGNNFIKNNFNIDVSGVAIQAENSNGGQIHISSSGELFSYDKQAISAKATGTKKSDIIISQSGIAVAEGVGIYAENTNGGNITINNSGNITSNNSSSVMATNQNSHGASGKITTNNNGTIQGYVTYSGHNVEFNNQVNGEFLLQNDNDSIVTNDFGTNGKFLNNGRITIVNPNINKNAIFNNVAEFTHNNKGIINVGVEGVDERDLINKDRVGNTITITNGGKGNFISNGGTLIVNTYIAPTGGKSDQLIIDNAITAGGSTLVHVIPTADSKFGKLTGDGIEIIKVKGTSSHDAFKLDAPVVNGEYEYGLVKGGAQSANSWFLRNTYGYNPAMGGYLANMKAASNLFAHTIHDRAIAGKTNLLSNTSFFQDLWLRTRIAHSHHHSVNNSFNNRDNTYMTQLGSDIALWQVAEGNLHMGIVGGYGHYKNTTTSKQTGTQASSQMNGYNLGLYGSWFENDNGQLGTYMDAWSQYSWFRNRITGKGNISDAKKYNSSVWSNSIELGYGFSITKNQSYQIILTPQAQFTYNIYNMKNLYDDKSNLSVTNDKGNGLVSRLGARLYGLGAETNQFIQPYLSVDWINSTAQNQLNFSGQHLKDDSTSNVIETKLGLVGNVNDKFSTSAQIGSQWGKDNYNQLQAQLNFNYNF